MSYYFYAPVGFHGKSIMSKKWSVSSNFMGHFFFQGFVTLPADDIRYPDQTANWWFQPTIVVDIYC